MGQLDAGDRNKTSIENRSKRAQRGVWTAGKEPYGRKFIRSANRQDGRWEIIPEKQRIIQDCAKRYLAGESIPNLASEYNMNAANLHKILTKTGGSEFIQTFKVKKYGIDDTVVTRVPALLDEETMNAVRAKAKANRTFTHGHIKHKYLFARMVCCAHCGYAMFGQANHNKKLYYRHAHTHREKPCSRPKGHSNIPAQEIENAVMRHLSEVFGNPSAVQRAIEAATPNSEKIQEATKEVERLAEELAKLEASRQRIIKFVVNDTITEAQAKPQLDELNEREQILATRLNGLKSELAHQHSPKAIKSVAANVTKSFRKYTKARLQAKARHANHAFDEMTHEEKRELCQMVFNGTRTDGTRMGIWISWNEKGQWTYHLDGYLIDEKGPLVEDWLADGAAFRQKELLVTKSASH